MAKDAERSAYILLTDGSGDSQQAAIVLQASGVLFTEERVAQSDAQQYRHPRLLTPQGSVIGLPHIRLFARSQNGAADGGSDVGW